MYQPVIRSSMLGAETIDKFSQQAESQLRAMLEDAKRTPKWNESPLTIPKSGEEADAETIELISQLGGCVTVSQIYQKLGLTIAATNNRMRKLVRTGKVRREDRKPTPDNKSIYQYVIV